MTVAANLRASKRQRQQLVAQLVAENEFWSQEELQQALRAEGVRVTQATLSRDIRDLGLAKLAGIYRPAPPDSALPGPGFRDAVRQLVIEANLSGSLLVLRTRPGNAHAAAIEIDRARLAELLGTVAGDDTILAVARSPRAGRSLLRRLREILG